MRTYIQYYIDPRWPEYLKTEARQQLAEYGYILMDDDSGYPVEGRVDVSSPILTSDYWL